jgi:hypothetical protein
MEQLGDSLGEALTEADASRLEVARIVVGSGVSLSVGIVAWLLRGGALAGSLLSMLPAWSSFDPIPILHQRRRNGPQAANVPSDATEQALSRILRPGVPPSAQV